MNGSLALLGLGEGFSSSELHSAYRAHVRLVHPDLATSDADRVRRTQATIRLNLAYAELSGGLKKTPPLAAPSAAVETPTSGVKTPTFRATFEWSRDTFLALAGAVFAGLAASTITGQAPLTVGVMLAGTLGARSAHDRDEHRVRSR